MTDTDGEFRTKLLNEGRHLAKLVSSFTTAVENGELQDASDDAHRLAFYAETAALFILKRIEAQALEGKPEPHVLPPLPVPDSFRSQR